MLVLAPVLTWLLTYRLCRERQRGRAGHVGAAGTAIRRGPSGGFIDPDEATE